MKRLLALLCTALLCTSCAKTPTENPAQTPDADPALPPVSFTVGALNGPTAMGLVKMMDDADKGNNPHMFTLHGAATELAPLLVKGEVDMACLPANAAAALSPKLEGDLQVLAVNTLGVLYITQLGDDISSIADLKGKTIVAAGQGASPEYCLRYLLAENGLDMDTDVTMDWQSEHAACVAALGAGTATVALLPQPFVTAAQAKLPDLRVALDLNQAWDDLGTDSALITGVLVAKKSTVDAHPEAVDAFLEDYAKSVDFVNTNTADAAALIGNYGIVPTAVAEKALPQCHIVCLTGEEMATQLSGYLAVLADCDITSVGGALPDETFYYQG